MFLGLMLSSGCVNFLKPEMGAVARKEARISLDHDIPAGNYETGDLRLTYSLTLKDDVCTLAGKIVFDRSLTDSFRVITKFFLYVSYLDDAGKVIETVEISPVIPTFGTVPDSLTVTLSHVRPPGSKAFAFHYFGGFRSSNQRDGSGEWDIYHFPFN
jgi:hypothetical protein